MYLLFARSSSLVNRFESCQSDFSNLVKVTARTLIALGKAKHCLHAMKDKLSRRGISELLFKRFHVQMHVKVGMSSGHSSLPSPHIRLRHPKQSPQPHLGLIPSCAFNVGRSHALCPTAFSCKPDSDESVVEDKGINWVSAVWFQTAGHKP